VPFPQLSQLCNLVASIGLPWDFGRKSSTMVADSYSAT
jgi:hypothetical protein